MDLVIVESPNKCKKIKQILGEGYIVQASVGHIADLPKKEIGVNGPNYEPNFILTEQGKKNIANLKELVKTARTVWLATDPDREGEAIAAHLAQFLKLVEPKRIAFHEITEAAIKKAFANPKTIDDQLYAAQKARRVIDRLVGYKVSPKLYQIANQPLSAGRVQSVALRQIVERERAIRNFTPVDHFGVKLLLKNNGCRWMATWDSSSYVTNVDPYILDRSLAEKIAAIDKVVISDIKQKIQKQNPPAPFITTTMQKAANLELGIDAANTMQLAQNLFAQGFITYHRTDNPNLSDESLPMLHSTLKNLNLAADIAREKNKYLSKANAQEAHEAIRPTDFAKEIITTNDELELKLYQLIRNRALASQMKPAEFELATLIAEGLEPINGLHPKFITKVKKVIYLGWMKLTAKDSSLEVDHSNEIEMLNELPSVAPQDIVEVNHGKICELKTKALPRYTEPALISKLEKEGIGRPATYAAILTNIKSRGYLQLKGKVFIPNAAAELIVDLLTTKFSFMELKYTKEMEEELDKIATGQKNYLEFVSSADLKLEQDLTKLNAQIPSYPCPDCDAPMRRYKAKKTDKFFWGCSRFKEGCTTTKEDDNGKPAAENSAVDPKHSCPACNRALRRINGKNGYFWGCSGFQQDCKVILDDDNGKPAKLYHCQKCNKKLRKLNGTKGIFWACSGYQDGCSQTYANSKNKPVFSSTN